jgi:ribulose-5-phosphate 4-epimerase/fuculose-1-phosphate aldolase
LPSP